MCTCGVAGTRREQPSIHWLMLFLPLGWLLGFAQVHTNVPSAILRVPLLPNQRPELPTSVWLSRGPQHFPAPGSSVPVSSHSRRA